MYYKSMVYTAIKQSYLWSIHVFQIAQRGNRPLLLNPNFFNIWHEHSPEIEIVQYQNFAISWRSKLIKGNNSIAFDIFQMIYLLPYMYSFANPPRAAQSRQSNRLVQKMPQASIPLCVLSAEWNMNMKYICICRNMYIYVCITLPYSSIF